MLYFIHQSAWVRPVKVYRIVWVAGHSLVLAALTLVSARASFDLTNYRSVSVIASMLDGVELMTYVTSRFLF